MTRARAAYLAAALFALTTACHRVTHPPVAAIPEKPTDAGRTEVTHPPVAAIPGKFTNAGRIEAMLSVHAHFLWPDKRFPADVRTISLEAAATYLAADTDGGRNRPAWSRRRRAIAEIAAVGLHRDEFRSALEKLGVDPDAIIDALREAPSQLTPAELLALIADMPLVTGSGKDCFANWTKLLVTVAPAYVPHADYTVKIQVPRSPLDVAKAIDPQSWDHGSKFFCPPERTYLAHLNTANQPVAEPRLTPYTEYYGRTLYEHFTCPLADCSNTTFENLLNVDNYKLNLSTLPLRYQVNYSLHTYLRGHVDNWSPEDVEILIDGGQLRAEDDGSGNTTAYVDKTLQFRNPMLTGIVNGVWSTQEQELAGEFAELACTAITNQIPTTCPP